MDLQETPIDPEIKRETKLKNIIVLSLLILSVAGNAVLGFRFYRQSNRIKELEEIDVVYSENYFNFDSITVDSFNQKISTDEEFVVMITRPNCPNCIRLEKPFIEYANAMGINDKIYHMNVVYLRRDAETWADFKEEFGFDGTPTYMRISGGKNVSHIGWTPEDSIELDMVKNWVSDQQDYFGALPR